MAARLRQLGFCEYPSDRVPEARPAREPLSVRRRISSLVYMPDGMISMS